MSDIPPEPGTIIEYLERDHSVIKQLMDRFQLSGTDKWGEVFRQLIEYLVRHEVAEEEVVFAHLLELLPGAAEVVEDTRAEQQRLALRLFEMERLSPHDPEFRDLLGHLRDEVLMHVAREEQVIIPFIRNSGAHDDAELVRRYELARTLAPSRPEAVLDEGALEEEGHGLSGVIERLRSAVLAHPSIGRH